jgi:hypothetical protein
VIAVTQNKTIATTVSVETYLSSVKDARRQADAFRLAQLFQEISGQEPVMWGPSIVGFGTRHYRYESGREGETPAVSFSPRANALALYIDGATDTHADLLAAIGKHTTGKACVYVKSLADIDEAALTKLVNASLADPNPGQSG